MTERDHWADSLPDTRPIGGNLLKVDGESLFENGAYSPLADILKNGWAVLLFDDMDSIGNEGLERLLKETSPQRKAKATGYFFRSDTLQSLIAYHLLKNALQAALGISGDVEISVPQNGGKPTLKDYPGISFNFSHCRNAVACAIDTVGEIGTDVESLSNYSEDLIPTVLNGNEKRKVLNSTEPGREFIRLWTLKESLTKARGEGLGEIGALPLLLDTSDGASFFTFDAPKYSLSVCRIG